MLWACLLFCTHPLYWVPLYNRHFKALFGYHKKDDTLYHFFTRALICLFVSSLVSLIFGPTDAPKDNLENMVSSNALNVLMQSSLLYSPTDSPYAGLL